jgi:hypothetical protein
VSARKRKHLFPDRVRRVILSDFIKAVGAARFGVMAGVAAARISRRQIVVKSQNKIHACVRLRTLETV